MSPATRKKLPRKAKNRSYRDFAFQQSPHRRTSFHVDVEETGSNSDNSLFFGNLTHGNLEPENLTIGPQNLEIPQNLVETETDLTDKDTTEFTELTVPPPTYTYTFIAPLPEQLIHICTGYTLAVPFRLPVLHGGYEGNWMIAALGDIRESDGQVTTILALQGKMQNSHNGGAGMFVGSIFYTDQDAIITEMINKKIIPAFSLQCAMPISAGFISNIKSTWF